MVRSRLIRNIKSGQEFMLHDATRYPTQVIKVRATNDAQEVESGFMTGRRRWRVTFEILSTSDGKPNYTWRSITGYSDERIDIL